LNPWEEKGGAIQATRVSFSTFITKEHKYAYVEEEPKGSKQAN